MRILLGLSSNPTFAAKPHLWILPITMLNFHLFLILSLSLLSFFSGTHQLQNSQTQVLYQLREQLEYPKPLEIWNNYSADLCYSPWSRQMNIVCHDNSITELKIVGDMSSSTPSEFKGFPISNQTLSDSFSVDSFITTLSRLTNLRSLSLISLGIWGPLPDKIHRLPSLEVLDLSSNFLHGTIPSRISAMVKLQVVRLDYNFFNGTVPDWFDSLSNLTVLSLKNNRLKGPIPTTICKIKTLTDLILSRNQISGQLPYLRNLTRLHVLDLRQNRIDSELPVMPQGLVTIYLSNNSFSGKIPEQFVELSQLQHLDLSFNFLQGTPLAALFSLPHIIYLNLASNMLSGSLPKLLHCGSALAFVDISTNKLTGGIPFCLSSLTNKTVKLGGNCLSVGAQHQNHESYCHSEGRKSLSWGRCVGLLVAIIGGIVLVLALVFLSIILVRRYLRRRTSEQHLLPKPVQDKPPTVFSPQLLANARFISQATKMGTEGVFKYRLFSIEELKEATSNFNQSTLIGEGSMGKLYRGRLENGTEVAIRSLTSFRRDSIRNLKLQLDLLSKLQHPHLVCLLGHCIGGNEQDTSSVRIFLIYEYVSGGIFRTHLSEISSEKVLEWSERLSVLIGVAKAVHFLHTGITPGFFNNNLRTNSILLNEHGIAKLSDYGLSTFEEEMNKIEEKGDNKSWKKTKLQDDVYNFGFILLETLVGPTAVERGATFLLNDMTSFGSLDSRRQVVDPTVLTTCSEESLLVVISITNKCISPEVSTRPSFEDVLWNLQYAAQVQATADGDQRSDVASQS